MRLGVFVNLKCAMRTNKFVPPYTFCPFFATAIHGRRELKRTHTVCEGDTQHLNRMH